MDSLGKFRAWYYIQTEPDKFSYLTGVDLGYYFCSNNSNKINNP